ncbi:hypothetical protein MUP59_06060 [Candidatus Bathyarchaeota archaeon]|nr:hypothetical protein [Candidatus Bathyarchaeota archaeon]
MNRINKIPESEIIKWWVDYHSVVSMTQLDIVKKYKVHKSTVNRLFGVIKNTPALLQKANAALADNKVDEPKRGGGRKKNDNSVKSTFTSIEALEAIKDENAFLTWWVTGERKGYIDRLLKKMQEV